MALLITPVGDDADTWISAFRRALPDMEARCWPDVGDRASIELAVVGMLPHGEIARLPQLRLIASIFAGQDVLLGDPTLPSHVPIVRTDDPHGDPMMAEFALLHVLRHHRNLPAYLRAQRGNHWERLPQVRASERRVGVMGLGPIGLRCVRVLQAAGFDVAAWARRPRHIDGLATFHGMTQLETFLHRTDILVDLLPLTAQTENILNRATLGALPRGAALVNLARGHHVVDADLIDLLDQGHLAAATLDAFRIEPLPQDHPFWSHPCITITPHTARCLDVEGIAARVAVHWQRLQAGAQLDNLVDRALGY